MRARNGHPHRPCQLSRLPTAGEAAFPGLHACGMQCAERIPCPDLAMDDRQQDHNWR
jgi:hypothetical protein